MGGLVSSYGRTGYAQDPSVIISWFNGLISQISERISAGGVDLEYPLRLLDTGVSLGSMIFQRHVNAINGLKLKSFEPVDHLTPEEIYTKFQSYLQKSELHAPTLTVQIKRIFYRKMNDSNWSNVAHIPWVKIFTTIIEFKMRCIYFSKTGKESIVCPNSISAPFEPCSDVKHEIMRLSRVSIPRPSESPIPIDSDSSEDEPIAANLSIPEEPVPEEPTPASMFQKIESQFEDEISKSKKTLIDAKVLIQILRKDFSRFEEIHLLRSTVVDPVAKRREKLKIVEKELESDDGHDMLTEMVKANQKRRRELLGHETFEPIDIDYGYEDAVLFDSENEPIDFEKPEEDLNGLRRESSTFCPHVSRRESSVRQGEISEVELSKIAYRVYFKNIHQISYLKNFEMLNKFISIFIQKHL